MKKLAYLVVLLCSFVAKAGSYEDFFSAIKRDDPATVSQLLARGFDPNTLDPRGEHGLYMALREPSLQVADVLIAARQTQVEWRNLQDESPLMMAALKGHLAQVRKLIERGADVVKPGWAPLHYAATGGNVEVVALLLEHHAYIDAESPNGTTPLMMAAQYGSEAAVKLLLDEGADPTLRNQLGLSAVDFANRVSRDDVAEMIAAAIKKARR